MKTPPVEQLLRIAARLRGSKGCPWDRKQTLATLKPFLIEECYETLEAIDAGDPDRHAEELGDVLLQIVLQAQIRREQGHFDFNEVVRRLCVKLVRRHPHVFGRARLSSPRQVLRRWEQIKIAEKKGGYRSSLASLPRHLPSLLKAHQVQSRAARYGFDWQRTRDVVKKIEEELAEVRKALARKKARAVREEIGDLLFAVVNLSRFQKLNAEELLAANVWKFVRRFQAVEERFHRQGRKLTDCSPAELDRAWRRVKALEKRS